MMTMPFNSSTPILFYNKDHFKAAGFEGPADDLAGTRGAALRHQEQGHLEVRHGLSRRLGVELPRELQRHRGPALRHEAQRLRRLRRQSTSSTRAACRATSSASRSGSTTACSRLAGQGINPGTLFIGGQCSTVINSTAAHAAVEAGSKFNWSATLPAARAGHAAARTASSAAPPSGRSRATRTRTTRPSPPSSTILAQDRHAGLVAQGHGLRAGDRRRLREGEGGGLLQGASDPRDRRHPA